MDSLYVVMKYFLLLNLLLFNVQYCKTVHFVIFISEDEAYLELAAQFAINSHNALHSNTSKLFVTAEFYKVSSDNSRSWGNIIKTICMNIENDTIKYPDIIVDLTPPSESSCVVQSLAHATDSGVISASYYNCPPIKVNFSLNGSYISREINIPSVKFLSDAITSALSTFGNMLAGSLRRETIIKFHDHVGIRTLFSDYYEYPSVGRFYLTLTKDTNQSVLMKLIEDIQEVVMTQTWIVLVDSVTARTLINCSNSLNHNDSQYWIVYEQNLDCSFICDINPVTGVENCLTMNSRNKLFCLNVDLGDSNQNETELIKTYFGKTWNNASVKQFDILSAYETVKSTLLALDSLVINNRWPDNFKPSGSSIKVCNQPNRIIDASSTRFYRFAEAITMLPKRNSTIGLIDFNGTVTNQRVKFQMTECFGKSNTSKAGCHRSSISFLYPEMIVQSLQNLSRSASRQLLHVSVLHDPPYAVRLGENQWTGYCVEVFKEIARRLDFDYTFVEQTDGDYGVRLPNGHWSGIIGQVARKNTDVGLGPLVQDAERSLIVDFTVPYYDSVGITMVNKVNEDLKLGALFFLEVFAWDVWVTTVVVVFLIGFMLAFIDKYSPYSYQNQLKEGDGESMGTVFTVKEALWYVLGSCTQQGEYMDPRSASTRVLVAGLWLLVLIIIAMFSANLAAKLTVTGLRGEITTFKQLIEQDTVKYTIINNSTEMRFFEKLKNAEEVIFEIWKQQVVYNNEFTSNYTLWQYPVTEKYGLLYSRMKEWGFTNRREETLQLIKDGWVIFMETPKADYYIAKECKIKRFGKRIGSWYYSMILLPRSPLTSLFNEVIYAMEADYTIDALKAKWWASETSKCEPIAADEGYGFEEVGGMFTLLICGLVIGVILLAGEIIVFQILLKKQKAKVEPEPPNSPPHSPTADNEPVSVQEGKEESVDNTPPAIPIAPASVTVTTTDYDEEEADKAVQSS